MGCVATGMVTPEVGGLVSVLAEGVAHGHSCSSSYTPSFFAALAVFVFVLLAIGLRRMHETTAALAGAVALWLVHYVGGTLPPTSGARQR